MPITMPGISRRRFLGGATAGALAWVTGCAHVKREEGGWDANRFALLSDTHVHFDRTWLHNGKVNSTGNCEEVVRRILLEERLPSRAFVCGDCVYLKGRYDDYATLLYTMKPLGEAGIPVHFALGNHDNRENFRRVMPLDGSRQEVGSEHHVMVVETAHANWFLVDSLDVTDRTPGRLGERQLTWLAGALDAHGEKPALVMLHHDPMEVGEGGKKTGGLMDTEAFYEVILGRKQVKMYIYGHTHVWQHKVREGVHLLNLPATAWVFSANQANGHVMATLGPGGGLFELRTLDRGHVRNGQKLELAWR